MAGVAMKALFVVAGLIGLSACATVHQTFGPDGKPALALNCSGTARGWDKCQAAAGERCGAAGYHVVDRSDEEMGAAGISRYGGTAIRTREREMLVECGQ